MRVLKIAGIGLAALVGLVLLAAGAVLVLVNPNDYRAGLENLVKTKTGRTLQIGGKLDLQLFPWVALSIADVRLGNPPGYGSEPFVTIKQASVGVKLLPLLGKRLEVSRVAVDGLTANLVSRSDEDNNWRDLSESKADAQKTPPGAAPQASIAGVELTNSSLTYVDEGKHSVTALSNLKVQTGALGGNDPVTMSLEFDYGDGGKKPVAHLALATRAQLPNGSPEVSLKDLDLKGTWYGASAGQVGAPAAQPLDFSVKSPAVVLDTARGNLAPATLDVKFGEVALQLTATGEKLFTDRVLSGAISVPRVSPRKLMASFGTTPPVTRDPKALSSLELKANYRVTVNAARLSNLKLTLDDTQVSGEAGVDDLKSMAVSYDLKVDAINVDRYLSPASKEAVQKPQAKTQSPPTQLPLDTLRKLDAHGTLQVGSATLAGLLFTGVSLPLTANDGRVRLGPTQAHFFSGTYNGDIVLDARPAVAQLSMNEHVKGMDVGALGKAAFDTTRVAGHGDANVVVTGVGNTDVDILRSLAGKIDLNVREGAINGVDLWYELRRARALVKRSAMPARTGPEMTAFNTLSGSGNLDKGVVHNDDLSIETDYLRAHGKGTFDLGTKAVDYRVVATVYKLPPEGAGSEMADLKAADIPFTIRGTPDKLTVLPDLEELAKAKVRQEVNDKLQEKSGELQKKLGDKLKGLFGH